MYDLILIVGLVAFIAGFGGGWKVNDWKESAAKVAEIKAANAARDAEIKWANRVSGDFEAKLAKQRVNQKIFYNEVKNETLKTVYTDCVVPDTGRVLLNRAISAANAAAGQPDPPVPGAPTDAKPAGDGGAAGVVGGSNKSLWGMRYPSWFSGGTPK